MKTQSRGKDLVIIGAGGLGREVKWLVERVNAENQKKNREPLWDLKGFIDDGMEAGTLVDGVPVIGNLASLEGSCREIAVACAIGDALVRRQVIQKIIEKENLLFPNLADPSVLMSERINLGRGNILCAGTILTVGITVQDFTILNPDCTVGHDARIGSYVTVYPSANICGCVQIGDCSEIGTGCHIIQGIRLGEEMKAGAGAVVIRDLPDRCVAVGNPAKVIRCWD